MEIVTHTKSVERKRVYISFFVPLLFVTVLSAVQMLQWGTGRLFFTLGINPRDVKGLIGIVTAPFIHDGFGHLFSNSIPLIVLGASMIYFYRNLSFRVFIWIWILDGMGVWLLGRPVYHIGASGLVYGMAGFVFTSGVIRKNRNLLALALAVVVMYGGLIWGIYPLENGISWEAHLFGLLAGIFCAVYYKPYGPPNDVVPEWMENENYFEEQEKPSEENNTSIKVVYHYQDKEGKE